MTTIVKADKSRLTIRGLVDGQHYIVREQPGGWFITPEKTRRVKISGMSADAFARLYQSRVPLDANTAKEISASLAVRTRQNENPDPCAMFTRALAIMRAHSLIFDSLFTWPCLAKFFMGFIFFVTVIIQSET